MIKISSNKIIDKIINSSRATIEEIVYLLEADNSQELFEAADRVRHDICGDAIHIRGIIEFSNHCRCSCLYCGINNRNKKLVRYRLTTDEIVSIAKEAYDVGYKSIVLQSGEDMHYDADIVSSIIKSIKSFGDVGVTLSVGERDYEEYKQWKKDGADRFLLKHETADENTYNYLHPHSSFKRRLECLHQLNELGYQTGSGFMIGLPDQTLETLAKDILLLQELDVAMAGIGLFIAHDETELKGYPSGSSLLTLKCLAITRILLKRPHLPTTTSLEVKDFNNRHNAFSTGANVIMKKLEPYKYRKLYDIYPNPTIKEKTILEERKEVEDYINKIGRYVSKTPGHAIVI